MVRRPVNSNVRLQREDFMDARRIGIGTAAYTFVTFPLAVTWHVVLFKSLYEAFGYFEGEPSFLLGLLTILIQGLILSALYPHVSLSGSGLHRGLKFAAIIGGFFWTSHVLAFVAKQAVAQAPLFMAMETGYLALQFGIFGILISQIYKSNVELKPNKSVHGTR